MLLLAAQLIFEVAFSFSPLVKGKLSYYVYVISNHKRLLKRFVRSQFLEKRNRIRLWFEWYLILFPLIHNFLSFVFGSEFWLKEISSLIILFLLLKVRDFGCIWDWIVWDNWSDYFVLSFWYNRISSLSLVVNVGQKLNHVELVFCLWLSLLIFYCKSI